MSTHVTLSGQLSGDHVVAEALGAERVATRSDSRAMELVARAGLEQGGGREFAPALGQPSTEEEG